MNTERRPRVVVAVSETAPIEALWRVTTQWLTTADAEVVSVYIADDRWQRAASLPFTREFSRTGRPATDFTLQRAQQVHNAAIKRVRERLQQLAAAAKRPLIFEILADADEHRLQEILGLGTTVIIAPSLIARDPLFARLTQFDARIELVNENDPVTP